VYGPTIDVAIIGVIRGTTVYYYNGYERGRVPEPVTGVLLPAGAVMLLRRRRVR
jgi:hypothetical protein